MGSIQTNTTYPIAEPTAPVKPSLLQRINEKYTNLIQRLVKWLRAHHWHVTSMVTASLLLETRKSIKAGFLCPLGWKTHFNFYNLNPKKLTLEQANYTALLLIHGNYHNQSAWLKFAKKLKKHHRGPVYTVNLPNGAVTQKDYAILNKKLQAIKDQYLVHGKMDIKIDIIGHSRGGFLAHTTAWRNSHKRTDIGKVILVGWVLDQEHHKSIQDLDPDATQRLFELTGENDAIEVRKSISPPRNNVSIKTGHVGLLDSKRSHKQLLQWLAS